MLPCPFRSFLYDFCELLTQVLKSSTILFWNWFVSFYLAIMTYFMQFYINLMQIVCQIHIINTLFLCKSVFSNPSDFVQWAQFVRLIVCFRLVWACGFVLVLFCLLYVRNTLSPGDENIFSWFFSLLCIILFYIWSDPSWISSCVLYEIRVLVHFFQQIL